MRLHAVQFQNFMLFLSVKKVFTGKDIIAIIAEYMSDPNRSNKGGKTTFIEAILYNLFGVSRAERNVELIHRGQDVMLTKTIWIDAEGKKVTIKRGCDIKNNSVLEIKGVDKKREAQEEINAFIGYDKDEFMLTNFFKQSDINGFMDMGSAGKKKYFMKWLQNTRWMEYERSVLDDIKDVKDDIVKYSDRIETLTELLEDQLDIAEKIKEKKRDLAQVTKQTTKLEATVSKLSVDSGNKKELRKKMQSITAQMDDLDLDIQSKSNEQEGADHWKTKLRTLKKELKACKPFKGDKEKLIDKRATAKARLDELKDKISNAEESLTGTCPVIGVTCDKIKPNCTTLKSWKQTAKKSKVKVKEMTTKLEDSMEFDSVSKDLNTAEQMLTLAKAQESDLKSLTAQYERFQTELKGIKGKVKTRNEGKLVEAKTELDEAQRKVKKLTERIGSLKTEQKKAVELVTRITDTRTKLEKRKKKLANLNYVAFMFGKNGIPSQEIENAFDEIEDEANFVLTRLGTNLQLEFKPDRELTTWEDMCVQCGWQFPKGTRKKQCEECGADREHKRKDELQLRVLEDGVDEAFYMESGGGKALVSIAVRVALTRLKQRQSNSKFNVLFLDEVDSAFDQSNKKAFMGLITKTLIKEFGFEQIFWVTHDTKIQESIPDVLLINRHATHSTAKWL